MPNNPETRMARFDALSPEERELANAYGVNVVERYRGMGAAGDQLRAACETHRQAKQFNYLRQTETLGKDIARRMQSRGRSVR